MSDTKTPQPGIYHDVPFREYQAWDAMNMSTLLEGLVSMEHLKAAIDGTLKKETKALSFGRAFHARILEPDVYRNEWKIATQCVAVVDAGRKKEHRCSNGGNRLAENGEWFCGIHGKLFEEPEQWVSADEARRIEDIASKIVSHRAVKMLRAHGGFETSIVWDYRGVRFKGRLDKYIYKSTCPDTIVDPKKVSVRRGGFDAFGKAIVDYNYHIRGAAYSIAAEILTGTKPNFVWVAIEDSPPYSIGTYSLGDYNFSLGKFHLDSLVGQYKRCVESGKWPGYSEDIREAMLPNWYVRQWAPALEQTEQVNELDFGEMP